MKSRKLLKAGGNTDYTIKQMPNMNHLFQVCKTGDVLEYAKIEETISPDKCWMLSGRGSWSI